jgi:hypothetical protein
LRYHAVSVVGGPSACAAAKELKNVRVLSAEAPRLPLDNCDRPDTCKCAYQKYNDRRGENRRADGRGWPLGSQKASDRRRSVGRRETD